MRLSYARGPPALTVVGHCHPPNGLPQRVGHHFAEAGIKGAQRAVDAAGEELIRAQEGGAGSSGRPRRIRGTQDDARYATRKKKGRLANSSTWWPTDATAVTESLNGVMDCGRDNAERRARRVGVGGGARSQKRTREGAEESAAPHRAGMCSLFDGSSRQKSRGRGVTCTASMDCDRMSQICVRRQG